MGNGAAGWAITPLQGFVGIPGNQTPAGSFVKYEVLGVGTSPALFCLSPGPLVASLLHRVHTLCPGVPASIKSSVWVTTVHPFDCGSLGFFSDSAFS